MLDDGYQITIPRHNLFAQTKRMHHTFSSLQEISMKEEEGAEVYFETEFEKERLEFLSDQVAYDKKTAVWAAKVLYHSAQLYMIRENTDKDLSRLIPGFKGSRDVSAILSADLSLRFLPEIITALYSADPEDILIKMLEDFLARFSLFRNWL